MCVYLDAMLLVVNVDDWVDDRRVEDSCEEEADVSGCVRWKGMR